jgi:hypothetical protein
MSPVPVDPTPDFVAGTVINPDAVDARFAELYKTLDPAQRGIDWANVRTGGLQDRVTVLPGSPRDGQEVYFFDAVSGQLLHLRYWASSTSAFKWDVVGAVEIVAEQTADVTSTSSGYTTLGTPVQVTAPLAGEYLISHSAILYNTTSAGAIVFQSAKLGAAATVDGESIEMTCDAVGQPYGAAVAPMKRTLAVGDVVVLQHKTSAGTLGTRRRKLAVRPLRVG